MKNIKKYIKKYIMLFTPFLFLFIGGLIVYYVNHGIEQQGYPSYLISSYIVLGLGTLSAFVELSSRYPDSPSSLLFINATQLYLTVNALLSFFALILIKTFSLSMEIDDMHPAYAQSAVDVITAVFSTQIIFRSSLFLLKDEQNGNQQTGGLSSFTVKLLEIIDSHVDRHRARQRSQEIHKIITSTSAEDLTMVVLPYVEQLLQNSDKRAHEVGQRIAKLYQADDARVKFESNAIFGEFSPHAKEIKSILIGLELYTLVGEKTLAVIMDELREDNRFSNITDGNDLTKSSIFNLFKKLTEKSKKSKPEQNPPQSSVQPSRTETETETETRVSETNTPLGEQQADSDDVSSNKNK